MSSFQFPANPNDGDIVVRGNLQAFYNAATNTWRVSEVPTAPGIPGPPGPPGPIGPPGRGVEVSGVVDTFADLPATNAHQFEYWVVSDTNTLYISDGLQWVELGGPIQGPQGEPGEDGADGSNGQNGRGWYDTNIIDERPNNYQISFLSNDGLSFTTDNIMGAEGPPGDLEVATKDNCGCIKVGRGLTIKPDGTLQSGETFVDLETVPLTPEGTPYNFALAFDAYEDILGSQKTVTFGQGSSPQTTMQDDTFTFTMPLTANKAQVFFFHSTAAKANPGISQNNTSVGLRSYLEAYLSVSGANFTNGLDANAFVHYHNFVVPLNSSGVSKRRSVLPLSKLFAIECDPGATVTFRYNQYCVSGQCGNTQITSYPPRIFVLPFQAKEFDRDADTGDLIPLSVDTVNVEPAGTKITDGDGFYYKLTDSTNYALSDEEIETLFEQEFPRPTPEETNEEIGRQLRLNINEFFGIIRNYKEDPAATPTEITLLDGYAQELRDLKNLPGDAQVISDEYDRIGNAIVAIVGYRFRFE